MPFEGTVVVTPIPPKGVRWRLVESFDYQGRTDHFTVPKDFETDFASVPRLFVWLLPRSGRWTQAAILHDYLWSQASQGELDKFDADGIFLRALRELEVAFLRRWIMWTAVRWAAGPSTWFQRGPVPFLKMLLLTVMVLPVVTPAAFIVLVTLIVGFAAEVLTYLALRVFHRDKRKELNAPDPREVVLS